MAKFIRLTHIRTDGDVPVYVNANHIVLFKKEKSDTDTFVLLAEASIPGSNGGMCVREDPQTILERMNWNMPA